MKERLRHQCNIKYEKLNIHYACVTMQTMTYHNDECPHAVSLSLQTQPVLLSCESLTGCGHHSQNSTDDQAPSPEHSPTSLAAYTWKLQDQNHTRTTRFVCSQCPLPYDCNGNNKTTAAISNCFKHYTSCTLYN